MLPTLTAHIHIYLTDEVSDEGMVQVLHFHTLVEIIDYLKKISKFNPFPSLCKFNPSLSSV